MMRRLPTVGPDSEPLWVRLYVHPLGDHWAAMIVADDVPTGPRHRDGADVLRGNA